MSSAPASDDATLVALAASGSEHADRFRNPFTNIAS